MAVKHIGGFGVLKIELVGEASVSFAADEAVMDVWTEEELVERKDLNHDLQQWYFGGRTTITGKMYNITDTSYLTFKTLAQLIDMAKASRGTLRVYPQYNSASTVSEYFDCLPPKKWRLVPIFEDCEKGQELGDFEMVSKGVRGQLPQHVDVLVPDSRVIAGGDTRVTADGDTRVVNVN